MMNEMLREKVKSMLVIEERDRKDVIIGAPHHTAGGVKNMPCPEHTDGDENTGFIAFQIAELLKASSIVACNYRIDPNKTLTTDYASQIIKWKPKYLIEIHGHGARSIPDSSIDISSGSIEKNSLSKKFSSLLQSKFQNNEFLKNYKICGDFNFIHFKASKSATIIDNRWNSIHIELPPSIRLDRTNNLPVFVNDFNALLAETIADICN